MLIGPTGSAAAAILPLYYLTDTGITLAHRIARGEPFWQAHRGHFYQRATDRGFSVTQIVSRIFAVNVGLVACAVAAAALTLYATTLAPGLIGFEDIVQFAQRIALNSL